MPTIYTDRDSIAQIVNATFPGYAGRKFKIETTARAPIQNLNWSGGSRSQYAACTIAGESLGNLGAYNAKAPWNNGAEGNTVAIPRGACVVSHSIFCGKDSGLTVYVNKEDLAPMLPAPAELSAIESAILTATAHYKASYMGRDRYDMARDDCRWSRLHGFTFETFPTREAWNDSKAGLIARGMLNKAGAITNAGRNAIAAR